MGRIRDTHRRSIAKAVLYRCAGIGTLFLITWAFTKSVPEATIVTLVYQLISIGGYYIYERIWNKMSWGRYDDSS